MLTSNSSNITDNSTNIRSLYEFEYEQFLNKEIASVVILTVLSFIGIVGNVHTLLIYSISPVMAKLTVRIFILWLSATDLIACVAGMPFEILDIRFTYTLSSDGACKFFRFLNHAVTLSSAALLTAIAIERYKITNRIQTRPIRNPFVVSLVVVASSIAISIPTFVFYGLTIKETGISGLTGTDCTVLSEYQHMRIVGAYMAVAILLSTVCCGICAVAYGKILFVIYVQMKKEKERKESNNYKMDTSSELTSKETQQVSSSQLNDVPSINSSLGGNDPTPVKIHKRSKYEHGRQLTKSLIVATAVSYLAYIIFVSTNLVNLANHTLVEESSIRQVAALLLRAFFINNAANPVVYCLLDNTFRTECLKLYKKTLCAK